MTNKTLAALSSASALTGAELLYGTQSSADVSITPAQIATYAGGGAGFVNVFNKLSPAEQTDVTTWAATLDVTSAITSAIAAIPSTGGVIYIPPGRYKTTGGFTISVNTRIIGGGFSLVPGATRPTAGITQIECTSASAKLFTVSADVARFENLSLVCTATATSGSSAIYVSSTNVDQMVDYEAVLVSGFYDSIDVAVGHAWTMHDCKIFNSTHYGVRVRNTVNNDAGAWTIDSSIIWTLTGTIGIRVESAGAGRIINNKIAANTGQISVGVSAVLVGSTQLHICNNGIEDVTNPIKLDGSGGWAEYVIVGNILRSFSANTPAIDLTSCNAVVISGNVLRSGSSTGGGINLTSCDNVQLGPNTLEGFAKKATLTTCTNVLETAPIPSTVANLPTAAQMVGGSKGFVTDANAATFTTAVASGGSNHVPCYVDDSGTPAWKIG